VEFRQFNEINVDSDTVALMLKLGIMFMLFQSRILWVLPVVEALPAVSEQGVPSVRGRVKGTEVAILRPNFKIQVIVAMG